MPKKSQKYNEKPYKTCQNFTVHVASCKTVVEYKFPWIIFADISRSNVKMVSRSVECNYLVEVFQILSELKFGKGAWWDLENFKMFSDDL